MDLRQWIAPVISALKAAVPFAQVRSASDATDRLEAVLTRQELPRCLELLQEAFGPAAKPMGIAAKLDRGVQSAVDEVGGVRNDQGLFLKIGQQQLAYAMLWPWESDKNRVTLRMGVTTASDQ